MHLVVFSTTSRFNDEHFFGIKQPVDNRRTTWKLQYNEFSTLSQYFANFGPQTPKNGTVIFIHPP